MKNKIKILAISGSPRKGNAEFILRTILNYIKKPSAEKKLILLRKKKIKFCRGCDEYCSKKGKCVIKDDMDRIIDELTAADVIFLATPTYFDNVSGLMKNFIDRTNPAGCGRKLKNKTTYLIVAGGDINSAKKARNILKNYCSIQKMKIKGDIVAEAYRSNEASKNKKVIEKCKKLARGMTRMGL